MCSEYDKIKLNLFQERGGSLVGGDIVASGTSKVRGVVAELPVMYTGLTNCFRAGSVLK